MEMACCKGLGIDAAHGHLRAGCSPEQLAGKQQTVERQPGGGGADKFRITIWDQNNAGAIVYDNQMGARENAGPTMVIDGGTVVFHK